MKEQVAEKAWEIAGPILRNEGLDIVEVEFLREGGRWVLRFFVEKPGAGQGEGISLDDCARASHAIETALDVADLVSHEYSLEVSSPGINRPLRRPEHFQKFLGHKVYIKTFGPQGEPPRKNFTGTLAAFEGDAAEVEVEGAGRFRIPLKDIAKAHLEVELPFGRPKER